MKTTIYLVRHAEVENPNHIIYCRLPWFRLSDRGLFQAKKLKEYFANKNISVIYASPLLRARKTSKIIADDKIKIRYSKSFLEVNYKKWQGLKASERAIKDIKLYADDPEKVQLGENLKQLQERMVKGIEQVVKRHPGGNIVIVSHADPIISAKLYYENKPLKNLNKTILKNASITSLVFDNELECEKVKYNEIVAAKKEWV